MTPAMAKRRARRATLVVPDSAAVQAASERCRASYIVLDRVVPTIGCHILGPDLSTVFLVWADLATMPHARDLLVVALSRHTPHPEA